MVAFAKATADQRAHSLKLQQAGIRMCEIRMNFRYSDTAFRMLEV